MTPTEAIDTLRECVTDARPKGINALNNDITDVLLDVAEAAVRVLDWIGEDRYTQLEKVAGGHDLVRALNELGAGVTHD